MAGECYRRGSKEHRGGVDVNCEIAEGVVLLARSQDDGCFGGQIVGRQAAVDRFLLSVVDVGPSLGDGSPGFTLALGESGFLEGVDQRQALRPPTLIDPTRDWARRQRWRQAVCLPTRRSRRRRRLGGALASPGPPGRGPAGSIPRPAAAGSRGCRVVAPGPRSSWLDLLAAQFGQEPQALPASSSSTLIQYW